MSACAWNVETRESEEGALLVDVTSASPAKTSATIVPVVKQDSSETNLSERELHEQPDGSAGSAPVQSNGAAGGRGERLYTQGDAAVADTLAAFTPGARGAVLLAEKMHDPLLTLSVQDSLEVTLAGIQCGVKAREQAKGKQLLMFVGNTGVGKSLTVNYIHGCEMERAAFPGSFDKVMRVREGSSCKEITQVGHSNQSMTFIPQLAADERFTYLDCPVPHPALLFVACLPACIIARPLLITLADYLHCLYTSRRAFSTTEDQRLALPTPST